jgi:hypothetical protein
MRTPGFVKKVLRSRCARIKMQMISPTAAGKGLETIASMGTRDNFDIFRISIVSGVIAAVAGWLYGVVQSTRQRL